MRLHNQSCLTTSREPPTASHKQSKGREPISRAEWLEDESAECIKLGLSITTSVQIGSRDGLPHK